MYPILSNNLNRNYFKKCYNLCNAQNTKIFLYACLQPQPYNATDYNNYYIYIFFSDVLYESDKMLFVFCNLNIINSFLSGS